MGKWDSKIKMIKSMAGISSTVEIAAALGTPVSNLHKICHRNGIKLPRDPDTYKGGRQKNVNNSDLEKAKELLLGAGYKVYAPDPFRRIGI